MPLLKGLENSEKKTSYFVQIKFQFFNFNSPISDLLPFDKFNLFYKSERSSGSGSGSVSLIFGIQILVNNMIPYP